ncbi:hypothetical protein RB9858 [Rhodopirellula baltica SH 1]|uniref:Uncharacterized protein n=1 Tax=Rhodopirellula baltica (strain DSM 10527 / NCIMB 13988 / SH1) TaxID=243090 RepID=Q7UKY6_RHOBA|nr:hypothetical protein RB9858 [Rhodopirellula baltica SH 1]
MACNMDNPKAGEGMKIKEDENRRCFPAPLNRYLRRLPTNEQPERQRRTQFSNGVTSATESR